MDCEGDIGWVPASYIKPVYGGNDDDDDDIVTESFPPGHGENLRNQLQYQGQRSIYPSGGTSDLKWEGGRGLKRLFSN